LLLPLYLGLDALLLRLPLSLLPGFPCLVFRHPLRRRLLGQVGSRSHGSRRGGSRPTWGGNIAAEDGHGCVCFGRMHHCGSGSRWRCCCGEDLRGAGFACIGLDSFPKTPLPCILAGLALCLEGGHLFIYVRQLQQDEACVDIR